MAHPNGFIRDEDPTGEQQLLDLAIAEAETEIQPHRMADDLDREAVILVGIDRWCVHAPSMAHQVNARQAAQQVDNASPLPEGGLPKKSVLDQVFASLTL